MGQHQWWMGVAGVALLGASGCMQSSKSEGGGGGTGGVVSVPVTGQTDFISADSSASGNAYGGQLGLASGGTSGAVPPVADGEADDRSVERGDIYRVLGDGRILNLNRYRGLQVIDVRDPAAPAVEGRLALTGSPVEMYVVGERAFVLLNDYRSYYGKRDDVRVEQVQGGLVVMVDISDYTAPVELDRKLVRGDISTSRLTQGDGDIALYVAAQLYDWEVEYDNGGSGGGVAIVTSAPSTVVKSFDASRSGLVEKSELDLGGYVTDIQATPNHLMVARDDFSGGNGSTVALIDISSPDGTMVLGQNVTVAGRVQNKFNMDITGNVMRIVSDASWSGTQENHLQTFDISDIANVASIDDCAFGANESLFATLFQEDSAFFVTYLRKDPFHAFSIDGEGHCAEQSEFIVSGWNDFFRTVSDDSRLVGIGRNDEANSSQIAVSLYDITDLTNQSPLITRAQIELDGAYTEAAWDDRAFSVLEDAVSVLAADGTEETGLVLMPFQGWDDKAKRFVADVQIFTFSDSTLTLRGAMSHGSSVRRSFLAEADTAANLSDDTLSLFDISDPDAATELGRLDLAPNYTDIFNFGDYQARVKNDAFYGGYYYERSGMSRPGMVEIVPTQLDPNTNAVTASFEVPGNAKVKRVGDLLVSMAFEDVTDYDVKFDMVSLESTIQVYDLSNPKKPRKAGSLKTDALSPSSGNYYGGFSPVGPDCWDCGSYGRAYWGGYEDGIYVAGDALVFTEVRQQQQSLGTVEYCFEYGVSRGCEGTGDMCTYDSGGISCTTPEGGETFCEGEFYSCTSDGECQVATAPPKQTEKNCNTYEAFRFWNTYDFEVLDLTDPDAPSLAPTIVMPKDHEGTSVTVDGAKVYFNFQQPTEVKGDARPFVKRFASIIDVSKPAAPTVAGPVNIPGEVVAAKGTTLFTQDELWSDRVAETMVARLQLDSGKASLLAQHTFPGRQVTAVKLDGAGHLLVSHGHRWTANGDNENSVHLLSILDADSLAVSGDVELDDWVTLEAAKVGRAVFSVEGGMLVVNTEDPSKPHAQAYFPTEGGGEIKVEGGALLFASGPYGIYRFDLDTYNLVAP